MKYGKQEPRYKIEPKFAYSDGEDATELVKAYGYDLDPWQREIITVWLGRTKEDKFTATSCGLSVPRQNGKNALLEVRELYGMVTMGEKILHTAHEVKTARQAFERLAGFFTNPQYPELVDSVEFIRRTNGQEQIKLNNGGSVQFSSRSSGANRGYTVDSVVFDEAQELTDEQFNALLPTLSASPLGNRQFLYTGTPPIYINRGDVFRRTRKASIERTEPKLAWHEWSVPELPNRDTSLDELVTMSYETNPAMGYRLTEEFTRLEAIQMSLDGFSRERLGWWSEVATTSKAIDETTWNNTFIPLQNVFKGGITTFGIKFSPDNAFMSVAGCRHIEGKPYHVEVLFYGSVFDGVNYCKEFFSNTDRLENCAGISMDGRNGVGMLTNELSQVCERRFFMLPSTKGCIDASAMFEQALKEGAITHTNGENGEQDALDHSALNATKRPVGASGGWCYAGDEITPLDAVTLALWANKTTKIDPLRKAVVW